MTPIPKNRRNSVNMSDNYRAIALSSVMGKVLDHIILHKYVLWMLNLVSRTNIPAHSALP